MTETADKVTVTCEGGPLDGSTFETASGVTVLNALAIKAADGTWVDPRKWANSHGFDIAEDAAPQTWPPQIKEKIQAVEYLIDIEHATAAFREPAVIREKPEQEPDKQWADADPRKSQEPRWIAWKTVAQALEPAVGGHPAPDECPHVAKCTTYAMHIARLAIDAIVDDGLRIVEPTRLGDAAEPLARLFHDTYERLAPDFGWETQAETRTLWEAVPENNRALMTATAREVLGSIDMQGRVVTLMLDEASSVDPGGFDSLGNLLRSECGASLMLVLPKNLGVTLDALDVAAMAREGWVRGPGDDHPETRLAWAQRQVRDAEAVLAGPKSIEFPAGPLDLAVATSCPHCGESFTTEVGHDPERRLATAATNELGAALHEHLNADHPNDEHGEVTIELVGTQYIGEGPVGG